ncbi:MAG: hypothetical protein GY798_04030 [Hyphomicrobiales bacterium]|nr:hypothetical protein [Hyphomicrobiales bacterium]
MIGKNGCFVTGASNICDRMAQTLAKEQTSHPELRQLETLDVSEVSPERFHETYVKNCWPVALRGWPLSAVRDWSIDRLIADYGDTEVLFTTKDMNFMAPLRLLRESNQPDLYLHNSENLLVTHDHLIEQLELDRFEPLIQKKNWSAQLFLGAARRTGLGFHCANNYNIFINIAGRKKWTIIPPEDTYFMYPLISSSGAYFTSSTHSPRQDTLPRFPLYPYATRFEVVLEPGDILFNPPWWWHAVENLTDETVAVSTRWLIGQDATTNTLLTAAQGLSPQFWRTFERTVFNVMVAKTKAGRPMDDKSKTSFERNSHTQEALEDHPIYQNPELAWGNHVREV